MWRVWWWNWAFGTSPAAVFTSFEQSTNVSYHPTKLPSHSFTFAILTMAYHVFISLRKNPTKNITWLIIQLCLFLFFFSACFPSFLQPFLPCGPWIYLWRALRGPKLILMALLLLLHLNFLHTIISLPQFWSRFFRYFSFFSDFFFLHSVFVIVLKLILLKSHLLYVANTFVMLVHDAYGRKRQFSYQIYFLI